MNKKSKKGFTLIELIVAIAVIAIAATFAFQLYVTGTKAVTNASTLDKNTQKIVTDFEGSTQLEDGTQADGSIVTRDTQTAIVTFKIDGVDTTFKADAETIKVDDGKTSTSLTHLVE